MGEFCSTWAVVACDGVESCCTEDTALEPLSTCLDELIATCEDRYPQLFDSAGWYDPAVAGVELELLRRSVGACGLPVYPEQQLVFSQQCVLDTDCSGDLGCYEGNCEEVASEGTPCDRQNCADGLRCVDDVCVTALQEGEDCSANFAACARTLACTLADEAAGGPSDVCAAERSIPNGKSCDIYYVCESHLCDYSDSTCSGCEEHEDCGDWMLCIDDACHWQSDVVGLFRDGAHCRINRNCEGGWCVSGVCATPSTNEVYCNAESFARR